MTAIEQLAAAISRPGRRSAAQREQLTLHMVDTIGALIAATRTPEGAALIRLRGDGLGDDVERDVATLCAITRLSEIDDIHLASMTTPGSIVIPAAIAIAANLPRHDAAALADAMIGGYEAMIRLNLALDGPSILYRGIWSSYFAAPFGTAAVASRLLGLDAGQTAHALALALTFSAPGVGHHNAATTARWLSAGQAARNGLNAALAAQAGFTADTGLLDGGFFSNIYAITPNLAAFAEALGTRSILAEVSFKPWCAARQTMAATQALKEIVAEGVTVDGVTAIKAKVLPPHRRMIDHGVRPGDRASYLTSLQYHMAIAAVAPVLADMLSPVAEQVPEAVHALMRKITVEPDETLLADYPRVWPAHVTVTAAGKTYERRVDFVPGDPARPFDADQVKAKFRRFAAPVLGEDATESLLNAVLSLVDGGSLPKVLLRSIAGFTPAGASSRPR